MRAPLSHGVERLSRSFSIRALSVVGHPTARSFDDALDGATIAHQIKPLASARAELAPTDYFDLR